MNAPTQEAVLTKEPPPERVAKAITPAAPAQLQSHPTPMMMLEAAVRQGLSIETLDKLMTLQERWESNEARKAFSAAMADFRAEAIEVRKNKTATFKTDRGTTQYDYATLDVVCDAVVGALSKHGLSHHWDTRQNGDQVTVTCYITHKMGHRESTSLTAGLDKTGSKNQIQALGSAVRYLERYTLLAVTGLAVKDKDDDDGHGTEGDNGGASTAGAGKKEKEKTSADYPAEAFKHNLSQWTELIRSGQTTAERIINKVSTKGRLTEEQEAQIKAIKVEGNASPAMIANIRAKAAEAQITEPEILKRFKIGALDNLPAALYLPVLAFIADPVANMGEQA